MLQKGFFLANSVNPNKPAETWTLVFETHTPGAYSFNAGWGKYKVEISGGGGSGSSVAIRYNDAWHNIGIIYSQNGEEAQKKTRTYSVFNNQPKTFSGIIGAGAAGSTTVARSTFHSESAGTPGAGYESGGSGTTAFTDGYTCVAGGSGGGSTSFLVNGLWNATASGGKGGSPRIYKYDGTGILLSATGGNGGGNDFVIGGGSAGGAYSIGYGEGSVNTSGAGANGYVKIWKSNLKPEDI